MRLEVEFNRNEYISRGRRFELAESLKLSETQIKIWVSSYSFTSNYLFYHFFSTNFSIKIEEQRKKGLKKLK